MSEDALEEKEVPSDRTADEVSRSGEAADERLDALRGRFERWCAEMARDWSQAFAKEVTVRAGELTRADEGGLPEGVAREAVRLKGTVKFEAKNIPLTILASEEAAIEFAKTALGAGAVEELDENAMSAFGEFGRQMGGSLEAVWMGEGLRGVVVEIAKPEKLENASDELSPGDFCASLAMSLGGSGEIPVALVLGEDIIDLFEARAEATDDAEAVVHLGATVERILDIDVPITVEIARRTIKVKDVLAFKPGTVLEFDKKSEDLLDLLVGRARIGKGEAVKVGESFGMRVLEIGCLRERIQSLKQ